MPDHEVEPPATEADADSMKPAVAVPATNPHITAARRAFEDAVRAWHHDDGSPSEVGRRLTDMLLAQDQPYIDDIPYAVRTLFDRFRRQHEKAVQQAVDIARGNILPATVRAELPPHMPVRMDDSFREGAD